ncbi:hypothetical protein CBR_g26039 [Chara braunii]|uniref:Uncharacterized protein n=1 Tax=Chara braunii TaxID=69332 RepID=A0A388L790_CHABU|nr:hypothetical protein CBR_g26039 [Chara braunii]|eukprot:GBG78102.1 hypothetical protein CBR_g26039 [Chara braunii]
MVGRFEYFSRPPLSRLRSVFHDGIRYPSFVDICDRSFAPLFLVVSWTSTVVFLAAAVVHVPSMADVFRRLPLLVLVVLLLLVLVVFHMCILGNVSRRVRRRRPLKKDVTMEGRQAICRSAGEQGGGQRAGQSPLRSSRSSKRSGYAQVPPHLQPLPDTSDEEADETWSQTVPLGSGSTQEWAATELCGSRDGAYRQSYTELLQQGLTEDEGDGGVNLSFKLCSGRSSATSRTVVVCPHPDDDDRQVTAVVRSSKSPTPVWEASGKNKDPPQQQFRLPSVSTSASAHPSGCSLRLLCLPVRVRPTVVANAGRWILASPILVTTGTGGRCGQNTDGSSGRGAKNP